MRTQSIDPRRLLQDSFTSVAPIYGSVLLLFIPSGILLLVFLAIPTELSYIVSFIYSISINLILTGSATFYVYQKLTQREVTVFESLQKAASLFPQLLLSQVLVTLILTPAILLLIIPGIYISIRLFFVFYSIVLENYSATDGIKRSWRLVQGHWWSVFWACLIIQIALWIPIALIDMIIGNAFGVSGLDVFLGTTSSYPAKAVSILVTGVFVLLVNPILITYGTLLFMSLLALKSRDEDRG